MRREVNCANRVKPHEYVQSIGGPGWSMTAEQAIAAINKGDEFFVKAGGSEVDIIVVQMEGKHVLRTKRERTRLDNLDNIRQCT
ncbi:MAG: DUF3892 domain-containing protein [Methanotrichaceae archaeon]